MKIVLCYPSLLPGQKPKYGLQPLGVLYIAALLREHGFDVSVIDGDVDGLTVDEMVHRILAEEPNLVGLSLMTPLLMTALECSARLKQARPDLRIVLGGAHVDSTHDDTWSFADCFDFLIYGEGEFPLLEVAKRMRDLGSADFERCLEGVGNVIYRNVEGKIITNPPMPFIPQLDVLPSVDYDMLDVKKYSIPTMAGRYVISMMLSRGCPFKCTFCDAPITMGKKLRFWSIERVLEDIRRNIEKYGCHNFVFKDSTFTANKKWAEQFCDALIASGLKIKWRCNTRVNLVPQPLLAKMRQAGCYVINFGVESGDSGILKNIQKEVKIEDVYDAHRRCRKLGIRTYATFLMGNPGETEATARRTIQVACGIRPNLAMFFVATAYPGTPMYEEAVRQGTVEPRWWVSQSWNPEKNSAFEVRWGWTDKGALKIPGFESEKWQKRATRAFYLRPYFIWDTLCFTARNPYFIKHLFSLGKELVPIYKLFGRKRKPVEREWEKQQIFSKCPSAPTQEYNPRPEIPVAGLGALGHPSSVPAADPVTSARPLKLPVPDSETSVQPSAVRVPGLEVLNSR